VKSYLQLTSPLTLLAVLGVLAVWLNWRAGARAPRRLLAIVVATYWFLSTPLGANVLLAGLGPEGAPLTNRDAAKGADTVVVLGGGANTYSADGLTLGQLAGNGVLRVIEAARVYRLIGARVVIASGGIPNPERLLRPESEMLRNALLQAGVPDADIVQESESRTTHDQARLIRPLLQSRDTRRFVLVTSPLHMGRALAAFRAQGLDPIPSPCQLRSEHLRPPPLWLPNSESLNIADDAVYSYAAWVYYRWHGWL
jgi:uncharacterized SAM-binding protein YcdF (DUF218 family)